MALRVFQFDCLIPAGTLPSALHTVPIQLDNWELESIDLDVPPGPSGLMGFYVSNNGVQWFPQSPGSFLVWDNKVQSWPVEGQPNASGWAVVGYNTGFYPHTVTVRFHVNTPSNLPATPAYPVLQVNTTPAPATEPVTL